MGEIVQRRQEADQGLPEIEIKALSGLSLKLDQPNQPNSVFKQLVNCDLYIPGSIRKVRPATPYGVGLSGQSYLNFVNYWAQPNKASGPINRLLAITSNAELVDMITGAVYVNFSPFVTTPIITIPYMEVYPLFFNPFNVVTWAPGIAVNTTDCVMKYGSYDGKFYIYSPAANGTTGAIEPAWDPTGVTPGPDGTVNWVNEGEVESSRFQENALIWSIPGFPSFFFIEYQYNPNNPNETPSYWFRYVGIFQPEVPIECVPVTIAPNLDGYSPVAGRGFVYTLYDPHTFHESSPSPFAGPTQINNITGGVSVKETVPGSLLPPLPTGTGNSPFLSYQSYYLAIPEYVVDLASNAGYTAIFYYATKDGGATFYRISTLLDDQGNIISNSDGSVPINTLIALTAARQWTDVYPLPTSMFQQYSCRVYEGSGFINLAPDPVNLGPQSWTQANAQDIVVVPGDGQVPPPNLGGGNQIWAAGELTGTNPTPPMKKSTLRSNKIQVTPGAQYFFEAFADATTLVSATAPGGDGIEWDVIAGDFSNQNSPYLTLVWGPGANGFQSGTFIPGNANVRLRMFANHVVVQDVGDIVVWSTPFLYLGGLSPAIPTNYPTPDDALVVPAPAALSQQPPPIFIQMAMYGGSIFGIEEGTFRIWFSNSGDFQSYGANSYLPLTDSAGVPVLELKTVYDRLLVGKQTSMSSVLPDAGATPPFTQVGIDPNHGVQTVRSSIGFGNSFVTLLSTGLTVISIGTQLLQLGGQTLDSVSTGFRAEHVIGDPIKPYTDQIVTIGLRSPLIDSPCPAVDTNRNFFLFSFLYGKSGIITEKLVVANMAHQGPSPWSELNPAIPVQAPGAAAQTVNSMGEIIDPTTGQLLLLAVGTGQINFPQTGYALFNGTQDGTLTAIAETWPLPDLQQLPPPMRDAIKIFHELWVEGEDIENWTYQWSTDLGETYSAPMGLRVRNKIGVNGRQISFKFTHSVPASSPTLDPLLSYMKITYSPRRQASGQNGY